MNGRWSTDASGNKEYFVSEIPCDDYERFRDELVKEFKLRRASGIVAGTAGGTDVIFQDFKLKGAVVGIEWDNWLGFIVRAKNTKGEALVERIGEYLNSREASGHSECESIGEDPPALDCHEEQLKTSPMKHGENKMGKRLRILGRPWVLVPVLVVVCWFLAMLGPLSLLIYPAFVVGGVVSLRRRAWVALFVLILLNPLILSYAEGVVDYFGGAPRLYFVGQHRIESFNLDRSTRCVPSCGGDLVMGNEWVLMWPNNSAVRDMACLFGPPSKSYDGPYPTKEEAQVFVNDASLTPISAFMKGQIRADSEIIQLQPEMVAKLIDGLPLFSLKHPQDDQHNITVRAKLYQERCVILRLTEKFDYSSEDDSVNTDLMIFFDKTNKRPFAYFRIKRGGVTRFPPVSYFPRDDR